MEKKKFVVNKIRGSVFVKQEIFLPYPLLLFLHQKTPICDKKNKKYQLFKILPPYASGISNPQL